MGIQDRQNKIALKTKLGEDVASLNQKRIKSGEPMFIDKNNKTSPIEIYKKLHYRELNLPTWRYS